MAWHTMRALNITSNSAMIELTSDGSWSGVTVYLRNGSFSGTLLTSTAGTNQIYDGGIYYLNINLSGLSSGTTYAVYASYQSASGATDLTDCSPAYLTTSSPLVFRGALEAPTNGYIESGATINVSGWALDPSGINYLEIQIDGISKGTTRTVIYRSDIYSAYPEYGTGYAGFQCYIDLANITYTSHTLTVYAIANGGGYNQLGSVSFTRQMTRPSNWVWSQNGYDLYSGGKTMSATQSGNIVTAYILPYYEWNNFTQRINDFRRYKGYSDYSFTIVSSGSSFTSAIINQAINAINPIAGIHLHQDELVDKSEIPASVFTTMEYKLSTL